ncbi:hypothetical protein [Nitrobacter sp. JJSN]|uniref:hypothetical protein n=1 Tax=Nitrobacter sp. JJSN TaxID=3453033 RepID=UPI003F75B794
MGSAITRVVKAAVRAEDTAKANLNIVQKQLNAGRVSQLAVLNAQQTYLVDSVMRAQSEANRLADTTALFMASGGGWPADYNARLSPMCDGRRAGRIVDPNSARYVVERRPHLCQTNFLYRPASTYTEL